ncbi:unnamed protein product [Bursaphelenchus xylophilus]|nr:unnamed protein product [Bursaphelenchus xylophilus]CAG9131670.1 unnamed protein product [Bursaphelenchus xylophilus]
MSSPSTAEFYSSITTFLQCLNLTTKFEGQVPNEFQIITHAEENDGVFIRYTYNPSEKNVTDEKLDLVGKQTGLKNYRFHLALEEDKFLTGVSGYKAKEICPVFNKAFEEDYCMRKSFFEILGHDLVRISCVAEMNNLPFKLNGTKLESFAPKTAGQFNCESKLAVFGDKIVFKNNGEDICKEINWAVDHVWKASECAKDDEYKLNSKNVLLFPLNYILIKFSAEGCNPPGPEVSDYLNNTYVKYLYNPNEISSSENVTIATVQDESPNWALIGGGVGGALVFLLLLIVLAIFLIRRYSKRQYRHRALYVRHDFSTAMETTKKCTEGFDVVKLKSGMKLVVPKIIDNAEVKRMVAQGEFGAFYEYEYKGTSYWYKLEAKLGPKYKQPLACESGVYQLMDKNSKSPDKQFIYIGSMLSSCQFSEGVYCMRVENYGPNIREMRQGQLMAPFEAQKLFFQLLYCMKALINYGICHRYIKESAFYVKKDRNRYRFVITDFGYAIRIGSERSAFYPIPETATTHIHAKKALKSEDTESLLYMVLGMMAPLPWAGMKKIEEVTKVKLECTDENSIPEEFFDIKEAVTLCLLRGLYTDDLEMENVATGILRYYFLVGPLDELHLPVRFPNDNFKLMGTFKSYDY